MIVYLIKKSGLTSLKLPFNVQGNYWLSYEENRENINLINIEATDGKWVAKSNADAIIGNDGVGAKIVILENYRLYTLKTPKENMYVFVLPINDKSFGKYIFSGQGEISIGKTDNNQIVYKNNMISNVHAKITKTDKGYIISNYDSKFGTYVNKKLVAQKLLKPRDTIFIMGLKIIYMGPFFAINNPNNLVKLNSGFNVKQVTNIVDPNIKEDPYINLYDDNSYFEKSPRFITEFERQTVKIDSPPEKPEDNDMPLLYTIGPMMTMGMISVVTFWQAMDGVANGTRTMGQSAPTIVMSAAMLMTMLVWPMLSNRFQKKQRQKKEGERQEKYKKYLQTKSDEINILMNREKQVLIENNISLEECQNVIFGRKRNLFEREIYQKDFLKVRLGTGSVKPNIDIQYPEEHFTLNEDNLKKLLSETINQKEYIDNVPVSLSLCEKNISAIIGENNLTDMFLESVIMQIMTFHSYRDLKIVFMTSNSNSKFSYLKMLPHLLSDNSDIRFYSENIDEAKELSNYLIQVLNSRKTKDDERTNNRDYKDFSPYYLIVVDDLSIAKNINIIKEILDLPINLGFSIIFRSLNLSSLPKECSTFITISGENGTNSGIFENELTKDNQQAFIADLNLGRVNMEYCVSELAAIPLRSNGSTKQLPKNISFLEMYDIGTVEQLNAPYRWQKNNPTVSLSTPVGIDENGNLFKLDLHEKRHGPHGLIAGMTGSGKSEFIITYILSLAINYHPNEVQFVLIDYKGGGLAGAFENRETGYRLPHLAGTITNLDTIEMNRALASINSELKRRQKLFNAARDKLGESTIDIYKYQRFYREGKIDKPISHLFIISDEFAELKMQRPEFMQELISTARIGRSLGVHLILATQKPSGIVDDQIWSNSKFRICLKVQDKADSKDMIGRTDAASLVDAGRFFMQVGYDEYFALGQSAYCGAAYYPMEKRQKKVDTSINFIDNIGNIVKTINDDSNINTVVAQGEELGNIMGYLIETAKSQNIIIEKLWLEKLPSVIYQNILREKYNYQPVKNIINPVIGEYDDPNNQRQGILTLPLSQNGNTIIYGTADSGKEDLLMTLIYSSISDHDSSEINFYILDFGSEILNVFKEAPQVGDVVTLSEEDKIVNMFKLLNTVIETRKNLLSKYNGDFNLYNEKEETSLPLITIIVNNYEALSETYPDCDESLNTLTRECFKYGIVFILTVSSENSVRYRTSQNFKQLIPLQLTDQYDYTTILGKTNGVYPSNIKGRGLVKLDDIYEFQTAYITQKDKQMDYIKEFCLELKSSSKYIAKPIPILPNIVSLDLLIPKMKENGDVPVGIYRDNLGTAYCNFKANYTSLISSMNPDLFNNFTNLLIKELIVKNKVLVLDTMNIIEKANGFEYHDSNFDKIIQSLGSYIGKLHETYENSQYDLKSLSGQRDITCVILGIGNLYNRLSQDNKKVFEQMMTQGSEIKKVTFIFVDMPDQLKTHEYDDWYRVSVNKNSGIWLGDGIDEQTVIRVSKSPRIKTEIPDNYGFVVNKGIAKYTKMLEGEHDE